MQQGKFSTLSGYAYITVFSSVADPDVYPGSEFFPSRIPDLHQRIEVFKPKKWFLSSRKYDPGCASRIRLLIFYPSRIPDPGSRGQKGTGPRIPDPDPQHWYFLTYRYFWCRTRRPIHKRRASPCSSWAWWPSSWSPTPSTAPGWPARPTAPPALSSRHAHTTDRGLSLMISARPTGGYAWTPRRMPRYVNTFNVLVDEF